MERKVISYKELSVGILTSIIRNFFLVYSNEQVDESRTKAKFGYLFSFMDTRFYILVRPYGVWCFYFPSLAELNITAPVYSIAFKGTMS